MAFLYFLPYVFDFFQDVQFFGWNFHMYLIIFQNVRWNLDKIKISIVQLASKANFSAAFCQYILFYSHIYNEREIYKITKYYIICIITAVSEWESYWQNEH